MAGDDCYIYTIAFLDRQRRFAVELCLRMAQSLVVLQEAQEQPDPHLQLAPQQEAEVED